MQNQVLYLYGSVRKKERMTDETYGRIVFDVEKCRAKELTPELVDCLSLQQAPFCGNSLSFGDGFFCKHLRRKEFVEITVALRAKGEPPNLI
jgi:hypothetical protein